ncbi:MAG: GNAT family N-acetyltransferase [Bacilli bacterium]|nr:GNAT family N-acetyltransferase [Bacilli bacterium]MBQ9731443.1 GNAT family N-acetyltransferase [Bacilli bacterium]
MIKIRKANINDLNDALQIYEDAIEKFAIEKTFQWEKGYPPNEESFNNDLKNNEIYVALIENKIVGVMTFLLDGEGDYLDIDGMWLNNEKYLTIHRIAVSKSYYGKGVGSFLINYAKQYCLNNNFNSIRIDTHALNFDMQKMLTRNGFVRCGVIKLRNKNFDLRVAYQLVVK